MHFNLINQNERKGSVSREFQPQFFHDSNPFGPLINRLEYFRTRFRFRRNIRIFIKLFANCLNVYTFTLLSVHILIMGYTFNGRTYPTKTVNGLDPRVWENLPYKFSLGAIELRDWDKKEEESLRPDPIIFSSLPCTVVHYSVQ